MSGLSPKGQQPPLRREQIDFILRHAFPGDVEVVLRIVQFRASKFRKEDAIRHYANLPEIPEPDREQYTARITAALALKAELEDTSDDLLWKRYEEAKSATAQANDAAQFFNLPGANADLRKWARKAYWTPEEAAALLLGKAPEIVSLQSLQRAPQDSPFRKAYEERLDDIERAVASGPLKQLIAPIDLLNWAKARDMEYPNALCELVRPGDLDARYHLLVEENEVLRQKVQELEPDPKKVSTRERNNLLTIIIAAAICKYTYMPSDKKNTAPERIARDIDLCGLHFTSESIRDKIVEASALLSEDFKVRLKKVGLSGIRTGE